MNPVVDFIDSEGRPSTCEYTEEPASERCREILNRREHALFGISPFNSYFSERNIRKLIQYAHKNFKDWHLIIPDNLPYFNLRAVGYTHEEAHKKQSHQNNRLLNKVARAFSGIQISKEEMSRKIALVSSFISHPVYCNLHKICSKLYEEDNSFRNECRNLARAALRSYTPDNEESALDLASGYLIGELPFVLNTPELFEVPSSLMVYHQRIDFFANVYKSTGYGLLSHSQGHIVLKFYEESNE